MNQQTQGYMNNYVEAQKDGLSQRELESRAFICIASNLNRIKEHWESEKESLPETLEKNKMLWNIIASSMKEDDCPHSKEVKQNILQLAAFVFKRTFELMSEPRPEGLDVLININMNIARGLNGNAAD